MPRKVRQGTVITPARIMALFRVMTVCVVDAALAYRIRQALTGHEAAFPDHTGIRM